MRDSLIAHDDVSTGPGAAAMLSRRLSLLTLGGAALTAALPPVQIAQAGKAGKKAKKRVRKTCRRQDGHCAAFFANLCEVDECDPEGLEAALACCAILGTCNAGEFMACIFDVLTAGPEPDPTR